MLSSGSLPGLTLYKSIFSNTFLFTKCIHQTLKWSWEEIKFKANHSWLSDVLKEKGEVIPATTDKKPLLLSFLIGLQFVYSWNSPFILSGFHVHETLDLRDGSELEVPAPFFVLFF